ncbi:protocadherin gamma-C5-like isoform 1-T1 [Mantella aurantiaca]
MDYICNSVFNGLYEYTLDRKHLSYGYPDIYTETWRWQMVILFLCYTQEIATETLQYSVMEEAEAGTLIGNVAKDLNIPLGAVFERKMQLRSTGSGQYFAVDHQSGNLTLVKTIDRENVCGSSLHCVLAVEIVLENPLELHRLEFEILDINDNSPTFSTSEQVIQITEFLAYPGARVLLEEAYDLDPGVNGVRQYNLSASSYFSLSIKSYKVGQPTPELVIEKALDREEKGSHHLILTALDGGSPPKSGISQITIIILDFNDNAPVFIQGSYKIKLPENVPLNTVVVHLNATDLDEGLNAEVEYAFDSRTPVSHRQLFSINTVTGVISTNAMLDFESVKYYQLTIKAKDQGTPQMEGSCLLQVEIEDVNDNLPEILLTSLLGQIPEDTNVGTTIGLFSVSDMDSGNNGEVKVFMSPNLPFKIKSFLDHYVVIVDEPLDRENTAWYEIILTAVDMGSPALSSRTTIMVNISDTNDNPPLFLNQDLNTYIPENNEPGHLLYTMSAWDPDEGSNAMLTYSIVEKEHLGLPVSLLVSINPITGDIYAQCSFDYEHIHVLEIIIQVGDSGDPRLSSNTTVFVFIVDTNDNSPNLLYPKYTGDSTANLNLSKAVPLGFLVTKLSAVDSDSGDNAWLSYKFVESSNNFLFNLSTYSGEIRTVRTFLPTDESLQKLVLAISDNGKPSLSLTVTIFVALHSNSDNATPSNYNLFSANRTNITLYLIISLVIISLACFITFTLLVVKYFKKELYLCRHPCCFLRQSNSEHCPQTFQPTLGFNMNGTLKYMEIRLDPTNPKSQCYRTYFSHSDNIGLTLLKPLTFSPVKDLDSNAESLGMTSIRDPSEQSQPNADWQFTQGQRPGPSGTQQPAEESGVWPNNQFETERLQAMILASANEAAEGSSGVGGSGTMGLSTRYGPQFTLQHVPDYRQNIYIPGTTTTLTNAAGKRDNKAPSGNKKKSGKKEKK